MRGCCELLTISAACLMMASAADGLVISVRNASGGETERVFDNGAGDGNPESGVIDFDVSGEFRAEGRLEETTVGGVRRLRLTQTPGRPAVGVFGNRSGARGLFLVTVESSPFAAVPAGATWRLSYLGRALDGVAPGVCTGNGLVTIPVHEVEGRLDGAPDPVATLEGPLLLDAAPARFASARTGATATATTSLSATWRLLADSCDGVSLPASIELELYSWPPEAEPRLPSHRSGALLRTLLVVAILLLLAQLLARGKGRGE